MPATPNPLNRLNKDKRTEQIGARIRKARHDAGLSLSGVSERTGGLLSKSRISNYEQGLRRIGLEEAEMIAGVIGVSAGYLLGIAA